MLRNVSRKTNITFSEKKMRRAVESVLSGHSIRSVAKEEDWNFNGF